MICLMENETLVQSKERFDKEQIVVKVQRADLTCDVIRKVAPFVLSKL